MAGPSVGLFLELAVDHRIIRSAACQLGLAFGIDQPFFKRQKLINFAGV